MRKKKLSTPDKTSPSADKKTRTKTKSKKKRIYNRFKYTEDALKEAMQKVESKQMSANRASKEFNIPKGTLMNKLKKKEYTIGRMGPATVLSPAEEQKIATWILDKARIGCPMHPTVVKLAIKSVLDVAPRPNPFKNNLPGRKWFRLFLKRHPEIALKNTEVLSKSRAAVTEEVIRQWFHGLEAYLRQENAIDILSDPSRIINMDETGVPLCPKTGKLLAASNEKNNYYISSGQEKENITVLPAYSADGTVLLPMIVYPYKRFPPKAVADSVPNGYVIGHSPKGWMTIETFNMYIKDCLYKQLVERKVTFPVLLLYDGHSSHISMDIHNFCKEKNIILYCLYPNATHIMQPCDVGIFRPLKKSWQKVVALHSQSSNEPITKTNFAPLFHSAFVQASDPEVIKASFKACGLSPFNPDAPNYSKCISTRRKEIKQRALSNDLDEEDSNDIFLSFIESHISEDTLSEFRTARFKNQEPPNEIILYGVWKNLKNKILQFGKNKNDSTADLNASDVCEKTCVTPVNSNSQHFIQEEPIDPILPVTSTGHEEIIAEIIVDPETTPSNIETQSAIFIEENMSFLDADFSYDDESIESSCDVPNVPNEPNVPDVAENIDKVTNYNYTKSDNMQPLDESSKKLVHNEDTRVRPADSEMSRADSLSNLQQCNSTKETLDNTQDSSVQKVNESKTLDKIWDESLHYPEIKKTKRRNTKKKIFAITSDEWKREQEEKNKKAEDERRVKEFKKFEREIKKKVKKEEIEARRNQKLQIKLEKEAQEKEKEDRLKLLLQQKAADLNLSPDSMPSSVNAKKRIALSNITNQSTACDIKKPKKD